MRTQSCRMLAIGLGMTAIAGCAEGQHYPMVFGQSETIGIVVAGNPTEQNAEITVGYRGRNIAVIPAVVRQANGDSTQILSTAGQDYKDALSVLGQFEADAKASEVSLGKFFATGVASQKLADGFAAKLGYKPPPPAGTN